MREDMDRVVIERPRVHGGVRRPKGERKELARQLRGDPDTYYPRKQPLERRWHSNATYHKEFSDLLGPLKRYAQSVIGRKFDDVYSEVRKVLSPKSKMQDHAAEHLWDFLIPPEKVLIGEDGRAYEKGSVIFNKKNPGRPIYEDRAYGDPRDGIIKRGEFKYTRKKRRRAKPRLMITEAGGRHFKQIRGIWYEVFFKKVPANVRFWVGSGMRTPSTVLPRFQIFCPGHWEWEAGKILDFFLGDLGLKCRREAYAQKALKKAYGFDDRYAVSVRQINGREISKLGLRGQ